MTEVLAGGGALALVTLAANLLLQYAIERSKHRSEARQAELAARDAELQRLEGARDALRDDLVEDLARVRAELAELRAGLHTREGEWEAERRGLVRQISEQATTIAEHERTISVQGAEIQRLRAQLDALGGC